MHAGAVDILDSLRASGHRVELVDGALEVDPLYDLRDEQRALLDALEEDLRILLAAGGLTIH